MNTYKSIFIQSSVKYGVVDTQKLTADLESESNKLDSEGYEVVSVSPIASTERVSVERETVTAGLTLLAKLKD